MNRTLDLAIKHINSEYKHILEFGVFTGATYIQLRNSLPMEFKLYGFDSFVGLPTDWEGTEVKKGGFNLDGKIPQYLLNLKNSKIYSGWFNITIPQYLKEAENIALLHIDSDLYSSAKDILYSDIKNYIKSGTVLVFDEWYYNFNDIPENRQHEQKLFFEWVADFNIKYELLSTVEQERQIIKIL